MTSRIELPCSAVVPGCEFVAHGETQVELLHKMSDHLRLTHGVEHMSGSLKAKIQASIDSAERQAQRRYA